MSTLNACDFAYPPGNVSIEEFYRTLRAHGILVVQRYLWRGGKGITVREKAAAAAAGVHIAYGYEGYASNWRGGAAAGVRDSAAAVAIARELGLPAGTPIYYAVDEDAAGLGMVNTAGAYVHAANHPDYPARGYGQYAVAEALRMPTFQTYAWSNGKLSKYAALYQWRNGQSLAGGTVDFCEIRDAAALGLHPSPHPTPEDLPVDQATFNNLMHGYATTEEGKTDLRMAVLYSAGQFRDSWGEYHTMGGWLGRIVGGNYQPWPKPARKVAESEDPPVTAAVDAPLVAQNMHTDNPRTTGTSVPGWFAQARKALVAVVTIAGEVAATGLLHGTAETVVQAIVAGAGVLGVYAVPNAKG